MLYQCVVAIGAYVRLVQDLELWITKEVVTDGFNLLARAGRVVQEVHVSTDMSREEMKATIQKLKQALL